MYASVERSVSTSLAESGGKLISTRPTWSVQSCATRARSASTSPRLMVPARAIIGPGS